MEQSKPFHRRRMTFLMLPDDLILNCLARVSRLYYPILSLVSKRFRSLLASMELYQTRSLLGRTENCLYVCLKLRKGSDHTLCWFTLCRTPKSSKNVLVPIFDLDFPRAHSSDVAVVGPNIYVIGGGLIDGSSSSRVIVIDSRSHTWREAPNMRVARVFPSACVVDGKIYVVGDRKNRDSTSWLEVFDPKTQTWEFFETPSEELCKGFKYKIVGYEGTIYVRSMEKQMTYKLHKGKWRAADIAMNRGWGVSSSYCVIDNVIYSGIGMTIDWYDPKERFWIQVKGLEGLRRLGPRFGKVKLADYGGKMAVLWEQCENHFVINYQLTIWCAQVTLERRLNGDIWGTVDWLEQE